MEASSFIILIPMLAGTLYHIGQKNLKLVINPFLVFFITYLLGAILMLLLYFANTKSFSIKFPNLDSKNFISLLMITLGFMGIELGFLLVYRSGLPISRSSFISSLGTSLILLLVGLFFFKEVINLKQWFGMFFASLAIFLLMK